MNTETRNRRTYSIQKLYFRFLSAVPRESRPTLEVLVEALSSQGFIVLSEDGQRYSETKRYFGQKRALNDVFSNLGLNRPFNE